MINEQNTVYIPEVDSTYVAWGDHEFLKSILKRRRFFPAYIAGPTGSGKSVMVEQVCAELGRKYCRIQITPETDEDSLIGGIRLQNGTTVFKDGPVIDAMRTGAVLMIDEIDRGSNKIMCLQGVMEGKPVTIKRTGEVVTPHPDFTVVATGNTKGRGDDSGKYMAAVIIDDAFLERFPVVFEHDYPVKAIEEQILANHMKKFDCESEIVHTSLIRWAERNRSAAEEDDTVISTRRLCLIAESYSFFKDVEDGDLVAIEYATNRFEKEDQLALMALYKSVRPDVIAEIRARDLQDNLDEAVSKTKSQADNIAAKIIADYKATKS